jgi:hypothetical protein
VRSCWIAAIIACAGCDNLFGLAPVVGDAVLQVDATLVPDANTTGWPTDGGIAPGTCWGADMANDEDVDGVADGCDNCPADPNTPGQLDGDRDGVGDVCDPHPTFAVERLAAFDGFNLNMVVNTTHGLWIESGGSLRQDESSVARTLFVVPIAAVRTPTLELKVHQTTAFSTAAFFYSGALILNEPNPTTTRPDAITCSTHFKAGPDDTDLARYVGGAMPDLISAMFNTVGGTPTTIVLAAAHLGDGPRCDAGRGAFDPNALEHHLEIPENPGDATMSQVGLWTETATAEFQSIMVLETTYPP